MRSTNESNAPVVTSTDAEVERLAREVAELRAENAANRQELEAVRADVTGQHGQPGPDTPPRRRDPSPKRRRGWGRGRSRTVSTSEGEVVSRRRLLGLAGTAAAAGVGGALLATSPSAATSGGNLVIDGSGNTNSGTLTTNLSSTTTASAFTVVATGAGGTGIVGIGNNGANASGVQGLSGSGYGLEAQGGLAPLFLAPSGVSGAPTTGNHQAGELYVDANGMLFTCVAVGTPGTWMRQSPLVTLAPARVYDSRPSQLPATGPKTPITNGNTVDVDVTLGSTVPVGASAVLGNITVVTPSAGVFLTVFAKGASPPATSNINAGAGQVIANNFTSKIGTASKISIQCGGGPTDFIIDVFGYYP